MRYLRCTREKGLKMPQAVETTCKALDVTFILGEHTLLVSKTSNTCAKCGVGSWTKNTEPVCEFCGTAWHFVATTYRQTGDDELTLSWRDITRHARFSALRFIGTATGSGSDFKVHQLFAA